MSHDTVVETYNKNCMPMSYGFCIACIIKAMAKIYEKAYMGDEIVSIDKASLNITSSAVLYGLSVYTVFPVLVIDGEKKIFRLQAHYERLIKSAKIIGIDTFEKDWDYKKFEEAVFLLVKANDITERVFVRATVHVDAEVAGTISRGLSTLLSMFVYEGTSILPKNGARIKTSVWRRIPDYAIPSRAKVNGAYINSVLGKQDAIDSGYDDCLFLDVSGHVCELSAANIFIVRDGVLSTPHAEHDILEGINRKTILELAKDMDIPTSEHTIDLTELYIADEIFACGTSAFVTPILEVDARVVGNGEIGTITSNIKKMYEKLMKGDSDEHEDLLTSVV